MATYGKKVQSDNNHLSNLTTARWVHIDGSDSAPQTVRSTAGRLIRVVLNTNGSTLTLMNGTTEVIGVIALDAPEGTYDFGIYCNDSIKYQASGAIDATLVFDD